MTELDEWVAGVVEADGPEELPVPEPEAGDAYRCGCADCRALRSGRGRRE